MIIMPSDNRIYLIKCRKSSRVRWCYADYQGRWESIEKAIAVAKRRYPEGEVMQFSIYNTDAEEVVSTGKFEATGEEYEEKVPDICYC